MKIVFIIIVFLHGLLHLLGFIKGFGFKDVQELTLPISRPMGLLWLTAALLLLIYGISELANTKHAWIIGFVAVAVSQFLIIAYWKDAKFGTIPNIAILIVSIISYGNYQFEKGVQLETNAILSQSNTYKEKVISEADIEGLPYAVKKWLRHSGAIGKPYITLGKVKQQAQMKLKPGQDKWFEAKATQYTTIDVPAFIWKADVKMNSFIYFRGRDKFKDGKGEMLIKLNSVINIVDEKGDKLNESSLQRYLGEMVWFPSLALSPYISWQEVSDTSAIATMDYKGTKGSGTFYFNSQGDFVKFSASRYKGNEADAQRYDWVLLVEEHKVFDGIKVPSKMTATWKLDSEDWTWLKLEIIEMDYDENARCLQRECGTFKQTDE